jgi:hypothetical protein
MKRSIEILQNMIYNMTYDIYMYIYIKQYYPGGGRPKLK